MRDFRIFLGSYVVYLNNDDEITILNTHPQFRSFGSYYDTKQKGKLIGKEYIFELPKNDKSIEQAKKYVDKAIKKGAQKNEQIKHVRRVPKTTSRISRKTGKH